jgi:hypothetical protein
MAFRALRIGIEFIFAVNAYKLPGFFGIYKLSPA